MTPAASADHSASIDIRTKRIYEDPSPDDGARVLVDGIWPRGVSKEHAELEEWLKSIAPSPELRKGWHADPRMHDPAHFQVFIDEYRSELQAPERQEALAHLETLARGGSRLTLLYALKDEHLNHAGVIRDVLLERLAA